LESTPLEKISQISVSFLRRSRWQSLEDSHIPNRQKLSHYCMNASNYDNFKIPKCSKKIADSVAWIKIIDWQAKLGQKIFWYIPKPGNISDLP
jgi:hypothetical protein